MRQIQSQKEKERQIQKETFKDLQLYQFNTIVVEFNLDELEEEEIEEEIPTDTEDELEYAPEFEDFDDDEIVESEAEPFEPQEVVPLRRRKYIVELVRVSDEIKPIPASLIQLRKSIDSTKSIALRTSTFLRLKAAEFIIDRQRDYIEGTSPLRRLTQRELLQHLNSVIERLDSKKFIKINFEETHIERFLETLYIKIPERGTLPAKSFFAGKRSDLSKEEWKTFVHEFIRLKSISEIETPTRELAEEFKEFLLEKGVEVEYKGKSTNPHDQYRTLKNKLREFGKLKE